MLAAACLFVCVGVGLWSRSDAFLGDDRSAQRLGTAMWAISVVMLLRAVRPAWSVRRLWAVGITIAWGVEFLQITGLPRWISGHVPPARLLLGSDFDAADLLWLAVGIVAGVAADGVARRLA
mgnify:CR=1 FL=1